MKVLISMLLGIVVVCSIYGGYWVVKTLSYSIFYEDMVRKTIVQMVKPEQLKETK